jgi:hypothetical protein
MESGTNVGDVAAVRLQPVTRMVPGPSSAGVATGVGAVCEPQSASGDRFLRSGFRFAVMPDRVTPHFAVGFPVPGRMPVGATFPFPVCRFVFRVPPEGLAPAVLQMPMFGQMPVCLLPVRLLPVRLLPAVSDLLQMMLRVGVTPFPSRMTLAEHMMFAMMVGNLLPAATGGHDQSRM